MWQALGQELQELRLGPREQQPGQQEQQLEQLVQQLEPLGLGQIFPALQ